jgi:hypothetical protein
MPRKKQKLIVAAHRVAEARRMIANLNDRIVTLKASGRPTLEAERALETYVSSLKHLEDHERRVKEQNKTKKHETKKGDRRFRIGHQLQNIRNRLTRDEVRMRITIS